VFRLNHLFPNFYFRSQYKRLAALQGDLLFQAPRRFLLEIISETQSAFAYRELDIIPSYSRKLLTLKSGYNRVGPLSALGAAHGFDIQEFFGTGNQPDFIGVDSISKHAGSISESGLVD